MSSSGCPDLARALEAGDLDAATERAVSLLATGNAGDPGLGEVARGWAARVMSRVSSCDDREEAFAEACVQVLQLLHDYRPGPEGSTASAYLGAWVPRIASKVTGQQRWHDDQKLRKAAALVSAARADLEQTSPSPSEEEVFAEALLRVGEQAEREILRRHPDASDKELAKMVRAKLTKDGLLRAFSDLRAGFDAGFAPVSLDATDDDGDPVHQLASRGSSSPDDEDLFEGLVGLLLGEHEWARPALGALFGTDVDGLTDDTLGSLAKSLRVPVAQLRTVGRLAALRARSPHAHWAHLVPAVDATPQGVAFQDA